MPSHHRDQEVAPAGVNPPALVRFLGPLVDGDINESDLRVSLLSGGRSNLAYTVTDGRRAWVLRRPPLGRVLETAHDMSREYQVMDALARTAVRVPGMIGFCADSELMGAPFYVMDKVDGIAYRDAEDFDGLRPAERRALGEAFVDVLARSPVSTTSRSASPSSDGRRASQHDRYGDGASS